MNWYFVAAAVLTFIIGLIHSVFGERLVFCRMRSSGFIPTNGGHVLREPHVRILWASWHLVTAFGWCIAVLLVWLALPSTQPAPPIVAEAIVGSMLVGSFLVLLGTRGKHLGWVGLLGVAVLAVLGSYA